MHLSRALATALVLLPCAAFADAPTLSWTRGAGADACPPRSFALAELESSAGVSLDRALAGRSLEVLVTRDEQGFAGSLFWRGADGALLVTRTLRAREGTCEEFSRAVITSALVALDTAVVPQGQAARPTAPVAPIAPAPAPAPEPAAGPGPTPARARMGDITLGGVLGIGWIPELAYGMQLQAEPLVYDRLRIGAVVTAIAEQQPLSIPNTGFSLVEFGVDVCGTLLRAPRVLEIAGCGSGRAGAVQSFSYSAAARTGGTQGSFALQAGFAFRMNPVGPLVVGFEPVLRWNASRYRLTSGDGTTELYSQGALGGSLVLRIGVHLP